MTLTVQDHLKIEHIVEEKLKVKFDEAFRILPTKEEFAKRMDTLSGEIKAVRDAQELHANQHSEIDDRFERVDKRLGVSTAA